VHNAGELVSAADGVWSGLYAGGVGCSRKLVEVGEMAPSSDVDFIRLDVTQLAQSLQQQCVEWITLLGHLLQDMARTNMKALQVKLSKYSTELITDPTDLEELKAVLQVRPSVLPANRNQTHWVRSTSAKSKV